MRKMSRITLIRHGQASFGAENYDQLSDLGRSQAAALGEYFLSQQIKFDKIIHGSMSRQMETAQILAKSKLHQSDLITDEDANEFDSDNVLKHYLPILAGQSDEFHRKIYSEKKWYSQPKDFELIFRALISLWQQDKSCPFESWSSFRQRSIAFLNRIRTQHGINKKIALVTSGGLISVAMQAILRFDDQVFMDMNLTINNASVTEITVNQLDKDKTKDQILEANLLTFNNISPLVIKGRSELITRK